jgi:hypothetical protein
LEVPCSEAGRKSQTAWSAKNTRSKHVFVFVCGGSACRDCPYMAEGVVPKRTRVEC